LLNKFFYFGLLRIGTYYAFNITWITNITVCTINKKTGGAK